MNWKLVLRWLNWILWGASILLIMIVVITFVSYNIINAMELTIINVVVYTVLIVLGLIYPLAYFIYRIISHYQLKKKINALEGKYIKITDKQVAEITGAGLWEVRPFFRKWKSGIIIEMNTLTHFNQKFVKQL
ncbi:MAG: hypothetical protein ACTSSI_16025, partial [Candidatus Helarchaeota archaeon]